MSLGNLGKRGSIVSAPIGSGSAGPAWDEFRPQLDPKGEALDRRPVVLCSAGADLSDRGGLSKGVFACDRVECGGEDSYRGYKIDIGLRIVYVSIM